MTLKVRPLSDVHNEFGLLDVPEIPGENETVCILAGDIGLADKKYTYVSFVHDLAERHRAVIYIPGNHEYYKTSFLRGVDKLRGNIGNDLDNVYVGDKFDVQIDDVIFICATLWTDMNNNNPMTAYDCQMSMNDYKQIRTGDEEHPYAHKLRPTDTVRDHNVAKMFIFEKIREVRVSDPNSKVFVVTHMAPSEQSIAEGFKGSLLNGAFASNLDNEILDTQPNYWLHGHVHASFDYYIGDTRVLCNPRGYTKTFDENPHFDPNLVIGV